MADEDYTANISSAWRDHAANLGNTSLTASGGGGGGKHRNPRFSWNSQYEATFFRSLVESVQLGLRDGSTFKSEAWERAGNAILERHNAYANKGHLVNKSDNARKKYRLWRGLRENPEFLYNPATHMITGSDDAWRRHTQKEPLSRSLKGRPFEHEEFYEILFPDVIGSGGAPKRLTKPRRRGPDDVSGIDEDTPGTAVMDLLPENSYIAPPQPPQQPQPRMPSTTVAPSAILNSRVPPPTAARPPIAGTSALTPPEENAPHSRKRGAAGSADASAGAGPQQSALYKRRRMTNMSTTSTATAAAPDSTSAPSRTNSGFADLSIANTGVPAVPTPASSSAAAPVSTAAQAPTTTNSSQAQASDGVVALAEALRLVGRSSGPRWQEQAMDIFFRDFGDEEMDLQLKISEKMLTDENKALVFVKMPDGLRRHWIKRLREASLRAPNQAV